MARITATIITLNEEANIGRAIRSVRFCDEVVVVDSGSSDRTASLAASLGATVHSNPWPGYAAQKNLAAAKAHHEWILSIDADEEVSAPLAREIQALDLDKSDCAGFAFPRLARYCGRWIRHSGWYPDRKVRLYRRDCARWRGSHIHESVRVAGRVGQLHGDLLHFTCDSLEQHRRSVERYTDLAAKQALAEGRPPPAWKLAIGPPMSFVKAYILQRGFLDGRAGLTIASMAARYVYLKHAKARKLAAG